MKTLYVKPEVEIVQFYLKDMVMTDLDPDVGFSLEIE